MTSEAAVPAGQLRAVAARSIARVLAGSSLDDVLAQARNQVAERDQPLLQNMAYGVLREHSQLAALAASMMQRSLENEPEVMALIELGLYQLRRMRIPPHAAVADTVSAATVLDRARHAGLINALLRRYQREREVLEAALPATAVIRHSMPGWLVKKISADWGNAAEAVLQAGNEQAPLVLRVNGRKLSRESWLEQASQAGLSAEAVTDSEDAVVLDQAVPVDRLPGFDRGEVSVQDASAQLVADLLQLSDGQRVLDACAAPGGKTVHMLERADVEVLALDVDDERLRRVQQNLDRAGLQAELRAVDAAHTRRWWDGEFFDRILLDAPCSGTGVIRRHPDIRWLRRPEDIARMAEAQLSLLLALWPTLAPGGLLVYATCSVLSAEGEDVAKQFITRAPSAKHLPIDAAWGEARRLGRRIAPGGAFDGFYFACFTKPAKREPVEL